MSESIEQFRLKLASLKKESEDLQRYKRDIIWLRTLRKELVRNGFD